MCGLAGRDRRGDERGPRIGRHLRRRCCRRIRFAAGASAPIHSAAIVGSSCWTKPLACHGPAEVELAREVRVAAYAVLVPEGLQVPFIDPRAEVQQEDGLAFSRPLRREIVDVANVRRGHPPDVRERRQWRRLRQFDGCHRHRPLGGRSGVGIGSANRKRRTDAFDGQCGAIGVEVADRDGLEKAREARGQRPPVTRRRRADVVEPLVGFAAKRFADVGPAALRPAELGIRGRMEPQASPLDPPAALINRAPRRSDGTRELGAGEIPAVHRALRIADLSRPLRDRGGALPLLEHERDHDPVGIPPVRYGQGAEHTTGPATREPA